MPRPPSSRLTETLGMLVALSMTACGIPTLDVSDFPSDAEERIVLLTEDKASMQQDLDDLLRDRIPADEPGAAVLVMYNNQVWYAKGQGLSDVDAATPISEQTVFDLASVSKQMTGLALLMLQEAGYLSLDEAVSKHLPAFEDSDPESPVLIRDLLHHTSGLADYTSDWTNSDQAFAELTLEDHLIWLNQQDVVDQPGKSFEYNNSGYGLLALMVQEVSGQPFAEFMAEHLFEPAGMMQTQVYQKLGQTFPEQAKGYRVEESESIKWVSEPSLMVGDGNIFSSIADLARYDQALRQGMLVSEQTLALAFQDGQSNNTESIRDPEEEGYGAGWSLARNYAHHSGSWAGTSTYYRFYQEQPISIVVLANDENFDSEELGEAIAELLGLE